MDHNRFKVFADVFDRRTSSGRTVPDDLLDQSNDEFIPSIVAINKTMGDVYLIENINSS